MTLTANPPCFAEGSDSLASSEISQGEPPLAEDAPGPSEAAVDLAASVDQFFDCCEGSQMLASSVLSSSMVSAKGVRACLCWEGSSF